MIREMEVSDPWASFIFEGRKKVEVRKNNPESWGSVKAGDVLRIKNRQTGEKRLFDVVETRIYDELNKCIVAEGVRHLLPGNVVLSGEKILTYARRIYLGFDGADEESMKKREAEYNEFGCIAIELKPHVTEQKLVKAPSGLSVYVDAEDSEGYRYTPEQIEKKVQEMTASFQEPTRTKETVTQSKLNEFHHSGSGDKLSRIGEVQRMTKKPSGHANYSKLSHEIECPPGAKQIWFKAIFDIADGMPADIAFPGAKEIQFGFIPDELPIPKPLPQGSTTVTWDDSETGRGYQGNLDLYAAVAENREARELVVVCPEDIKDQWLASLEKHGMNASCATTQKEEPDSQPKRPASAYLFFAAERRPQLKQERPDMGFGELTSTIAAEWKQMSKAEKKRYEDMHEADEQRYKREMADVAERTRRNVQTHINGSSRPEGDPNCRHQRPDGKSAVEYNDDTMGGCGSGWEKMCSLCGKVWYE